MSLESRINLIPLPEANPSRGNKFTRFLGRNYMAFTGWRFAGSLPKLSKFVMVLAPHTSNMDFMVGMGALFSLGIRVSFLAKHTLFWEPMGSYLRWVGGVPIDRSAPGGAVLEAVRQFQNREKFVLVITPEGTRKRVERWKTGFYFIAEKAGVPILPLTFDYGLHEVRFGEVLYPSGKMEEDMQILKNFFTADQARKPDSF